MVSNYFICNKARNEKKVPKDWTTEAIVPIHKNGDPKICNNCRGIILLSTAARSMKEYWK